MYILQHCGVVTTILTCAFFIILTHLFLAHLTYDWFLMTFYPTSLTLLSAYSIRPLPLVAHWMVHRANSCKFLTIFLNPPFFNIFLKEACGTKWMSLYLSSIISWVGKIFLVNLLHIYKRDSIILNAELPNELNFPLYSS